MSEKTKPEVEKAKLELGLKKVTTDLFKREFGIEDIFLEEPNFEPVPWPGGEHTLSRDCVLSLKGPDKREQVIAFTTFNKGRGEITIMVRILDLSLEQFSKFSEPDSDKIEDRLANAIISLRREAKKDPSSSRIEELGWSKDALGTKFKCPDDTNKISRLMELTSALDGGGGKVIGKGGDVSFVANREK